MILRTGMKPLQVFQMAEGAQKKIRRRRDEYNRATGLDDNRMDTNHPMKWALPDLEATLMDITSSSKYPKQPKKSFPVGYSDNIAKMCTQLVSFASVHVYVVFLLSFFLPVDCSMFPRGQSGRGQSLRFRWAAEGREKQVFWSVMS